MHTDSSSVIQWSTKCISGFNSTEFDNSISQFAGNHDEAYNVAAITALVLGLIMLFFGYSLFYATLATAGLILGGAFGFFFLCGTTDEIIAAAIGGAVLGLLLGVFVVKLEKLGVAAVGIAGGLIAALYTNGFVMTHLYSVFSATNQSWMPYAYAAILAALGCYLAFKIERLLIITATSFGGAYAVGFGVIRLAWGSTHADLGPLYLFSGNGCEGSFCKMALVCIVLGALLGMAVQLKRTSSHSSRFSKSVAQDVYVVGGDQDHRVVLIQGQGTKKLNL